MKPLLLRRRQGVVLLDDEDYERFKHEKVYSSSGGYAAVWLSDRNVLLHHLVLNYFGPLWVDHINQNKLDNQKHNLRIIPPGLNQYNRLPRKDSSSKVTGVNLNSYTGKWGARVQLQGKRHFLGWFETVEEATNARTEFMNKNNLLPK